MARINRRRLLCGTAATAAVLSLPRPTLAWPVHGSSYAPVSSGGWLMNLVAPYTYTGNPCPFLNWFKAGGGPTVTSSSLGALGGADAWVNNSTGAVYSYLNPTSGELNVPCPSDVTAFARGLFTPPLSGGSTYNLPQWWNGLTLNVTWTGDSVPTVTGSGATLSNVLSNSATLTFASGASNVGLSFSVPDPTNPPINLAAVPTTYVVNYAAGEILHPVWKADHAQFGVLRYMKWQWGDNEDFGPTDISQFADANYSMWAQESFNGFAHIFAASITGSVLTVTSADGTIRPQMTLGDVAGLVLPNTVILYQLSGTKNGDGTYQLSQTYSSPVSSETMYAIAIPGSYYGASGTKGGIHPALVCKIANETGTNVHYVIPNVITDACMTQIAQVFANNLNPRLWVRFEYGNENWNSSGGSPPYRWCQQDNYYPPGSSSFSGAGYSGYRTAQLWEIVANVFGPSGRHRWRGAIGGGMAQPSFCAGAIQGALYWIQNGSAYGALTDLFDELLVANYFSNGPTDFGANITGVTPGSTTTLTAANSYNTASFTGTGSGQYLTVTGVTGKIVAKQVIAGTGVPSGTTIAYQVSGTVGGAGVYYTSQATTASGASLTSSPVVRLFFSNQGVGTVGNLLNNQDVTIASANSTSFTFTNYGGNSGSGAASTVGLTYTVGTDYYQDGLLYDLMDDSNSNFISNPTSYPTKYTYFAEQQSKAVMLGYADNGWTMGAGLTLQCAQYGSLQAGVGNQPPNSIFVPSLSDDTASLAAENQQIAKTYGLQLAYYEGGEQFGGLFSAPASTNAQLIDYCNNAKFDVNQTGSYTIAAQYAQWQQYADDLLTGYSAQFTDTINPPWMALRYYPGDESNAKWQAILAQNTLGPFVDPTPPATGSYAFLGGYYYSGSTSSPISFTMDFGSNAPGVAVVGYAGQAADPTGLTLTTPSSGTLTLTEAGTTGIFYVDVPANMGTQTFTATFASGAFQTRTFAAWLLTNLISNTPYTYAAQSTGSAAMLLPYIEGGALICAGANDNGYTAGEGWGFGYGGLLTPAFVTGPTADIAAPGAQYLSLNGSSNPSWGLHACIVADFTNPIFNIQPVVRISQAAVVWR